MLKYFTDYVSRRLEASVNIKIAEANKIKAETETSKLKAEAETMAIRAKTEAETMAVKARYIFRKRIGRIALVICAALVGDFIYHECDIFIKWNMKRRIRQGDSVAKAQKTSYHSTFLFPREGSRSLPPLGELPVLLVGPSGCGKTTALLERALSLKAMKRPVVVVNIRELQHGRDSIHEVGKIRLKDITERICDRISFPYRQSILGSTLSSAKFIIEKLGFSVSVSDVFPRDYFIAEKAIGTLFKCLAEIATEVDWRGNPVGMTPVLIMDEVYDLIKDEDLAKLGGTNLFRKIGLLLTIHCVDEKIIHAIVASSSYHMVSQFQLLTTLKETKVRVFNLLDLEPAMIIAHLQERGYSESEATRMLDIVGPRLRALSGPLKESPPPQVQSWIDQQMSIAGSSYRATFNSIDKTYWRQLISLLDDINQNGPVLYMGDNSVLFDRLNLSRVMCITDETICFQSRLHKNYWAQNHNTLKNLYLN